MVHGKRYVDFAGEALTDDSGVIWFGSFAKAKAAAQADYERRILSALVEVK